MPPDEPTAKPPTGLDPARRDKVIETALKRFLDDEKVAQAMVIWRRDFAHRPKLSAGMFAAAISDQVPDTPSAHVISTALLQALQAMRRRRPIANPGETAAAPPVAAPPASVGDETPALTATADAPEAPSVALAPELVVFNSLVAGVVGSLDAEARTEFRAHIEVTVGRLGLTNAGLLVLRPWCVSIDRELVPVEVPVDLADLRKTLHEIYVWMCEYDGPSATDRLFARLLRAADTLPEAASFPPRRLL